MQDVKKLLTTEVFGGFVRFTGIKVTSLRLHHFSKEKISVRNQGIFMEIMAAYLFNNLGGQHTLPR